MSSLLYESANALVGSLLSNSGTSYISSIEQYLAFDMQYRRILSDFDHRPHLAVVVVVVAVAAVVAAVVAEAAAAEGVVAASERIVVAVAVAVAVAEALIVPLDIVAGHSIPAPVVVAAFHQNGNNVHECP